MGGSGDTGTISNMKMQCYIPSDLATMEVSQFFVSCSFPVLDGWRLKSPVFVVVISLKVYRYMS